MSFECGHYLNGHCVLRETECVPGAKGCVLNKAKVRFIDFSGTSAVKKEDKKESSDEKGVKPEGT